MCDLILKYIAFNFSSFNDPIDGAKFMLTIYPAGVQEITQTGKYKPKIDAIS